MSKNRTSHDSIILGMEIEYNGEKYICKEVLNKDYQCIGCCFYRFGCPCMRESKEMQCMDDKGNDYIWIKEKKKGDACTSP